MCNNGFFNFFCSEFCYLLPHACVSLAILPQPQIITVGDETGYNVDIWSLARVQSRIRKHFVLPWTRGVVFHRKQSCRQQASSFFFSVVGATTYTLLRDLLAPEKSQAKDINVLFETLRNYYEPKPLVIAERF